MGLWVRGSPGQLQSHGAWDRREGPEESRAQEGPSLWPALENLQRPHNGSSSPRGHDQVNPGNTLDTSQQTPLSTQQHKDEGFCGSRWKRGHHLVPVCPQLSLFSNWKFCFPGKASTPSKPGCLATLRQC